LPKGLYKTRKIGTLKTLQNMAVCQLLLHKTADSVGSTLKTYFQRAKIEILKQLHS
jgi:hypothetical protein